MSSIRLFVLDALARRGDMHGHQLRLLAEEEHVHLWTDISVGALYGALKRLAGEGLLAEVRTEREGGYPERQVYGITDEGRVALAGLQQAALEQVVLKPDPFDLGLSRPDPDRLDDLPAALEHIAQWGSGHSEAIVADSARAIADFTAGVDAAAVLVNASTRFTDGGEFGFGAEIGISTQKLHARGPLGLPELTSTTYVVTGRGHVR